METRSEKLFNLFFWKSFYINTLRIRRKKIILLNSSAHVFQTFRQSIFPYIALIVSWKTYNRILKNLYFLELIENITLDETHKKPISIHIHGLKITSAFKTAIETCWIEHPSFIKCTGDFSPCNWAEFFRIIN